MSTIKTANESEKEMVIAVLTLSFSTDPLNRWAFNSPDNYLNFFPSFAKLFGGMAFNNSTAWYIEDFAGAALWLPPSVEPDYEAVANLIKEAAPENKKPDLFNLMDQMEKYHPSEPLWYLPMIGVDPLYQNQGHGSALLKQALAFCDRDRTLAYLESSNPKNIPLYERHGFKVLGKIQVGTAPVLQPMLRKPQ